jgi:hypothetical protein
MEQFLKFRENAYFASNPPKTLYVFETIRGSIVRLAYAETEKSTYWFTYPGMHIKAETTRCCKLSDLTGLKVSLIGNPEVIGTLLGHTGIVHTAFAYVFWGRLPSMKHHFPCALPSLNNLTFL